MTVCWGIAAALVTAFFTWQLWRSNRAYQDVVKADANARIAESMALAATANKEAATANAEAAKANAEAAKANERAQELENDSKNKALEIENLKNEGIRIESEGKERVAEANKEIARLTNETEEAKLQLETERLTRIEMEKTLSRRSIPLIVVGGKTNIDGLLPFSGMQVIIKYLPDIEARRASWEITQALTHANWKIIGGGENPELAQSRYDGVTVESYLGSAGGKPIEEVAKILEARKRPDEAADALVKFLSRENNWQNVHRFPAESDVPPNTIKIRVGFKPVPNLKTKFEEDFERQAGQAPKPLAAERTEQRHITVTQRASILKSLAPIKQISGSNGMYKIPPAEVRCPASNKEACVFADEIAKLLRGDGWPIKGDSAIRDTDFPRRVTGILIREKARDSSGWANWDLFRALKTAGFEVEHDEDRMASTDSLQILVGW